MRFWYVPVILILSACGISLPVHADALHPSMWSTGNDIQSWQPGIVIAPERVDAKALDSWFVSLPLPDSVLSLMHGRSMPQGCKVNTNTLKYLHILHRDKSGRILTGELVVAADLAQEVLDIFKELYLANYPIEKVRLIDYYDGADEASMEANNSSGFCYRTVAGSKKLSAHAHGRAIDINPLYNPCIRGIGKGRRQTVKPRTGEKYVRRNVDFPYKIVYGDACHRAFTRRGWRWGGSWRTVKDYQHFEKR